MRPAPTRRPWMEVAVLAIVSGAACGGTASFNFQDGSKGPPGSDAGTDASNGTVPSVDGSTGGDPQLLACGSVSCSVPAQSCCVSDPPSYACISGPSCPVNDAGVSATALRCSGAANCAPNTVCCVYETPTKQVASDCKPACGGGEAQLCNPTAANSGCAPDAGACSSANVSDWGLPSTYATCGGVGS